MTPRPTTLRVSYADALNDPVKSALAAVNQAIAHNLKRAAANALVLSGEDVRNIITGRHSALRALAGSLAKQR